MTPIGNPEITLLLKLLEAKVLRFTHTALDVHGDRGRAMIDAGFLVSGGFESVGSDNADRVREAIFDPVRNEFGVQDSLRGWVRIDRSTLVLYKPDLNLFFAHLLGDNLRSLPGGAVALVGDAVWHIGSAYLTKRKPTEIWFSRRLNDPLFRRYLMDFSDRSQAVDRRLVLTSTSLDSIPWIARTKVVPIADVLSWHSPSRIDFATLEARLDERIGLAITQTVYLSDDDAKLYIHGQPVLLFRGKLHKHIVRCLVNAHHQNKPIKAAELLAKAGSQAGSFDQAFGPRWAELKQYLRPHQGYWRFEI
ncbi:hypothetical protein [Mesorhizobium sp.]|uniref:hypothetical protein n=1 Tax=Mesorhizobium sp. TaxID=1871066 RepID=UPI000FE69F86|nr:hypothetical protein [Mesorhizobium sp.]RWP04752.1 MAG: hypothetical protein EOQ99_17365 [Mesorhizobium sp.]TIL30987.1 MAG: hypothetical protein E5Y82_31040 [Mesorhizobium sp.]TIM42905.1 MAG: hypothetical protein E5Y55_21055 [Mesorhizobium sp.]